MYVDKHWVNYKVAFVHCISKLEVLGEHLKTLSLNVRFVYSIRIYMCAVIYQPYINI